MNVGTSSHLLIADAAHPAGDTIRNNSGPAEPLSAAAEPTVKRPVTATGSVPRGDCDCDVHIIAGSADQPASVLDRARFHSVAEARRWTALAILYWQADAPQGSWVTGQITARPPGSVS